MNIRALARSSLLVVLLVAPGCDATPESDAGVDAASIADAPIATDGFVEPDAFTPDPDASVAQDAGTDAAMADASGCSSSGIVQLTDGLLFTSESDYPLELMVFDGEGDAAPTVASVLALSPFPSTATTEMATVDRFFASVVIDPTITPPVPEDRPALLRAAIESEWTDLVVVRIIDPDATAQVHFYLAGRTACGALAWLTSVSIET
jgi:hypothetical protein